MLNTIIDIEDGFLKNMTCKQITILYNNLRVSNRISENKILFVQTHN